MTNLMMPRINKKTILKKKIIVKNLKKIVKSENVLDHEDELRPFETDGLSAYKQKPLIVVFPENTEQVSEILKYCNDERIKVVPRGAGTGLSGGALPLADCVLLSLGKFNKILEIDYKNRCVVSQPGVTNLSITQAVQDNNFYYAPDPSSQIACSIGGNVAENSGGIHSLKYGTTLEYYSAYFITNKKILRVLPNYFVAMTNQFIGITPKEGKFLIKKLNYVKKK